MRSNIRLKTNVLCEELITTGGSTEYLAKDKEICERLSSIEFFGLSKAMPLRFSRRLWQEVNGASVSVDVLPFFFEVDLDAIPDASYSDNPFTSKSPESGVNVSSRKDISNFVVSVDVSDVTLSTSGDEPLERDDSEQDGQYAVLSLPFNVSALVIAPPGTGKTHLLIEKVARLVDENAFENLADEMLILSFSRAAVREVSERLKARSKSDEAGVFDYVRVRTFDSFAGYMLTYEQRVNSESSDYDASIRELSEFIDNKRSEIINEKLAALKYLVIDEIQDLSKDRASLVLRLAHLVSANGGGLLMLGDPCQAIYDWDVKGDELKSLEFLRQLRAIVDSSERGSVHRLNKYFRYSNPQILDFVKSARECMGEMGEAPAGSQLISRLYSSGGILESSDVEDMLSKPGRTAMLCRSNVDAHDAAVFLRSRGHEVFVDEGSRSVGWPGWMSASLLGWESKDISLDKLESKIVQLFSSGGGISPDWRWYFKEADVTGVEKGFVNVEAVYSSVYTSVPDVKTRSAAKISVSTIHKSKGLEYDNVLLLEPTLNNSGDPEEVRIAYVAATRAKENFSLFRRDRGIFKGLTKGFRYDRSTRGHQYFFSGVEDFEVNSMLSQYVVGRDTNWISNFRASQKRLWSLWQSGTASFSAKTIFVGGARRVGVYLSETGVFGGDTLLGLLSRDTQILLNDKARILGGQRLYMASLPVTRLESVAFPDWSDAAEKALGTAGLILVPTLRGFAELVPLTGEQNEN